MIHIEKADADFDGSYQYINQQFLLHEFPELKYANRECDMGVPGLRKAKESYHPIKLLEKWTAKFF